MFLWVEACSTAIYLQNRSPHKVLGKMTIEEAFTGEKPNVGHLHTFGYLVYWHVPVEKRTKLEPTAVKGIFIVYSETSKAYKVDIPALKKTVVRRDVRFEEDKAFRKSCGLMPIEAETQE